MACVATDQAPDHDHADHDHPDHDHRDGSGGESDDSSDGQEDAAALTAPVQEQDPQCSDDFNTMRRQQPASSLQRPPALRDTDRIRSAPTAPLRSVLEEDCKQECDDDKDLQLLTKVLPMRSLSEAKKWCSNLAVVACGDDETEAEETEVEVTDVEETTDRDDDFLAVVSKNQREQDAHYLPSTIISQSDDVSQVDDVGGLDGEQHEEAQELQETGAETADADSSISTLEKEVLAFLSSPPDGGTADHPVHSSKQEARTMGSRSTFLLKDMISREDGEITDRLTPLRESCRKTHTIREADDETIDTMETSRDSQIPKEYLQFDVTKTGEGIIKSQSCRAMRTIDCHSPTPPDDETPKNGVALPDNSLGAKSCHGVGGEVSPKAKRQHDTYCPKTPMVPSEGKGGGVASKTPLATPSASSSGGQEAPKQTPSSGIRNFLMMKQKQTKTPSKYDELASCDGSSFLEPAAAQHDAPQRPVAAPAPRRTPNRLTRFDSTPILSRFDSTPILSRFDSALLRSPRKSFLNRFNLGSGGVANGTTRAKKADVPVKGEQGNASSAQTKASEEDDGEGNASSAEANVSEEADDAVDAPGTAEQTSTTRRHSAGDPSESGSDEPISSAQDERHSPKKRTDFTDLTGDIRSSNRRRRYSLGDKALSQPIVYSSDDNDRVVRGAEKLRGKSQRFPANMQKQKSSDDVLGSSATTTPRRASRRRRLSLDCAGQSGSKQQQPVDQLNTRSLHGARNGNRPASAAAAGERRSKGKASSQDTASKVPRRPNGGKTARPAEKSGPSRGDASPPRRKGGVSPPRRKGDVTPPKRKGPQDTQNNGENSDSVSEDSDNKDVQARPGLANAKNSKKGNKEDVVNSSLTTKGLRSKNKTAAATRDPSKQGLDTASPQIKTCSGPSSAGDAAAHESDSGDSNAIPRTGQRAKRKGNKQPGVKKKCAAPADKVIRRRRKGNAANNTKNGDCDTVVSWVRQPSSKSLVISDVDERINGSPTVQDSIEETVRRPNNGKGIAANGQKTNGDARTSNASADKVIRRRRKGNAANKTKNGGCETVVSWVRQPSSKSLIQTDVDDDRINGSPAIKDFVEVTVRRPSNGKGITANGKKTNGDTSPPRRVSPSVKENPESKMEEKNGEDDRAAPAPARKARRPGNRKASVAPVNQADARGRPPIGKGNNNGASKGNARSRAAAGANAAKPPLNGTVRRSSGNDRKDGPGPSASAASANNRNRRSDGNNVGVSDHFKNAAKMTVQDLCGDSVTTAPTSNKTGGGQPHDDGSVATVRVSNKTKVMLH